MATFSGSYRWASRHHLLMAACGTALVVATGTSIGAWRLAGQGHTGRVQLGAHQVPAPAVAAPSASLVTTPSRPQGIEIYLVSSDEEESFIRQTLGAFGATLGQSDSFVVTNSDEVATALKQQVASENAILAFNDLPPVTVADLRQTPAVVAPTSVSASQQAASENAFLAANGQPPVTRADAAVVAPAGPRLFLVSSGADAQTLQQMLAAASVGAGQAGFAASDSVLQADPEASVDEVTRLLSGENESRAARGLQPIQVVDLR